MVPVEHGMGCYRHHLGRICSVLIYELLFVLKNVDLIESTRAIRQYNC